MPEVGTEQREQFDNDVVRDLGWDPRACPASASIPEAAESWSVAFGFTLLRGPFCSRGGVAGSFRPLVRSRADIDEPLPQPFPQGMACGRLGHDVGAQPLAQDALHVIAGRPGRGVVEQQGDQRLDFECPDQAQFVS